MFFNASLKVLSGLDMKHGDKVLILDWTPGFAAEFLQATFEHNAVHGDKTLCAYLGIHLDATEHKFVQKTMRGTLLTKWWDVNPEAGPKTRPANAETEHPPPLKVCAWKSGRPVPLPDAEQKFQGTAQNEAWQATLSAHRARFSISEHDRDPAVNNVCGPDWTCPPHPQVMTNEVQLTLTDLGKNPEEWCAAAPAKVLPGKRPTLGLFVAPDTKLYLDVPDGVEKIEPQELCGFNIGSFSKIKNTDVQKDSIPFMFRSDADHVILVEKNDNSPTKTLMPLASVFYRAFKHYGIPVISLDDHVLSPAGQAHWRFDILPCAQIHVFKPDLLKPDNVKLKDGAHMRLKHGELGAMFFDKIEVDATSCLRILWEVEIDVNPPAAVRAVKPKCWIVKQLTVKSGLYKI
jgi:hypothetical protein